MKLYYRLFLVAAIYLNNGCTAVKNKADIFLKNAKIYTVDEKMTVAGAIAIGDGKIFAVGAEADLEQYVDAKTRVIDLQGKTVVPGLIDSHYHFTGVGKREYVLNLDGTTSLEHFLGKVKAEVAIKPDGEWILGRGWIEEDWPSKEFPTRYDLDKVAPDNPVILTRADGHAIVVNSLALKLAGIDKTTPNPQGGEIIRDKDDEANGLILDKAMQIVRIHAPSDSTTEMITKYALKANEVATKYGLTQVHDMGVDFREIGVYKNLYNQGKLKIRIAAYVRGPGDNAQSVLANSVETGLFDHKLSIAGIKITQDGALGSRGAALVAPYSDAETKGLLIYKDEQIYPYIKHAAENGLQMAIHAIGDAANKNILDLYEKADGEVGGISQKRFRIEHAQIVQLDDISRFRQLGVIPSMQPSHAIGDLHFAVRRLGVDRIAEAYAWRKFLDQGNIVPAGSDAPVEEGNPMIEFYAAVVRKDTTGFSGRGWFPEYRMTREEALKALTIWGAQAAFSEQFIGSLEPGKYGDLVVLDQDLMTAPESELFNIKVLMTMIAGEIVYENENFKTNSSELQTTKMSR
jgi:hypothetical protein